MKNISSCPSTMNRRRFVSACATCLGCFSVLPLVGMGFSAEKMSLKKLRIRVVLGFKVVEEA